MFDKRTALGEDVQRATVVTATNTSKRQEWWAPLATAQY